jgi:hypothetical protein
VYSFPVNRTYINHINPSEKKQGNYTDHKAINEGWLYFWKKRGYIPPPPVSTYAHGVFIMPSKLEDYESRK